MADRSTWWDDVDAELAARGTAADDPWSDGLPDAPWLTVDQEAFLVGLEDQPPVPRLTGVGERGSVDGASPEPGDAGRATGSPPGDSDTADS